MKISTFFFIAIININCFSQINNAPERIKLVKEATVQIIIDDTPTGTGFFINKNGLVASNMHVINNESIKVDTISKRILSKIQIKLNDGTMLEVVVPDFFQTGKGYQIGLFYDFICLEQKDKSITTPFLKLGNYSDLNEGDYIYTCGYPFGIKQPIFSSGLVSTKFKQSSGEQKIERNAAWLDLSMNKGNSGGAVLVIKDRPENDEVVGIASFNLNVLNQYATQLKNLAKKSKVEGNFGGIDIKSFAQLTAISIEANFYGVGGLISIEYLKNTLK